jgi:hypothetical protein
MKILESGVRYELESFKKTKPQVVEFTSKGPVGEFIDGTTNEEVVDMLISRMYALQAKNYSPENQCAIILLKSVKQLLQRRLTKKIEKVNGKEKYKDKQTDGLEDLLNSDKWSFGSDSFRD